LEEPAASTPGRQPSGSKPSESPLAKLTITRAESLFARRLTVISFGAALIGEKVTGKGCVSSIGMETGVPLEEVDAVVFILAGLLLVAAFQPSLWPSTTSGTVWSRAVQSAEYIVDSLLCVAFSASLIVEAIAGKGVLAVLQVPDLGTPLTPQEAAGAFLVLLFLTQGSEIFTMTDD